MTRGSILEYKEAVRWRYLKAGKKEKGRILDEFIRVPQATIGVDHIQSISVKLGNQRRKMVRSESIVIVKVSDIPTAR